MEDQNLGEKMGSLESAPPKSNGDMSADERRSMSPADAVIWSAPGGHQAKSNGLAGGGDESAESSATSAPAPARKKGHGLRRWRRIAREPNREDSAERLGDDAIAIAARGEDSEAQMHKRRLPIPEAPKARGGEEAATNSDASASFAEDESSVASVESQLIGMTPLPPPPPRPPPRAQAAVLNSDLELMMAATGFSIGSADSDNSEDKSSKSSTAASAPRLRHETGFGRDRTSRTKASGAHKGPHGRALDSARKVKADDRVRIVEPENSRSSVETANVAFVRHKGVVSNGNYSDKSVMYNDGEHSDEGQQGSEEVRSGYYKENGSVGNMARSDADANGLEESGEKGESSGGVDPYVESAVLLQTAQEMLEAEIEKFTAISKETSDNLDAQYEETEWSDSPCLEAEVNELNEKITALEYKLEESIVTIKEKDSRLVELESLLNRTQQAATVRESSGITSPQETEEVQSVLELLLKEKMEAEIQYIVMTRASQTWKVLAEDQVALCDEQKSLSGDYKQLKLKLKEAEDRAPILEEKAEKLEMHCKEISSTAEVLKLQNRTCRVSLFCLIQLVMLFVVLGVFLLQLRPSSVEVVPHSAFEIVPT